MSLFKISMPYSKLTNTQYSARCLLKALLLNLKPHLYRSRVYSKCRQNFAQYNLLGYNVSLDGYGANVRIY